MIGTIERTETKGVETLDAQTEADLLAIEADVVGNYTLADALREGALSTKQVRMSFGSTEGEGCALTAIAAATIAHGIAL